MAINFNKYCICDFETNGLGPGLQPISIGAVMLDPRKLEICDNGTFYSTINIIEDDSVEEYNLDKTEQKALDVNKITMEELRKAPPIKKVWKDFCQWVNFHNPPKTKWDAPIFTGYNTAFDIAITNRIIEGHLGGHVVLKNKLMSKKDQKSLPIEDLAKAYKNLSIVKEPWGFGPNWLFHPSRVIDVMQISHLLFESLREPHSGSLDSLKSFLGFGSDKAHNALIDCLWTAEVLVRYLKIQREVSADTDYETGGETLLPVQMFVDSF